MIVLCVLASCLDAFLFGVSFGLNKIRITCITAIITSLFPICFGLVSMWLGKWIGRGIDASVIRGLSVGIYLLLAVYSYHNRSTKEYSEGTWIDQNKDLVISGKEIVLLALSLSLDTWIIALPLGFSTNSIIEIASLFGIFNFILLLLGNHGSSLILRYIPCRLLSFSWVIYVVLALLHS